MLSHKKININECKPLLKWAGGKTQLLNELLSKRPKSYAKYIEPFIGGGALFFNLKPMGGVIADSNPELTNLYKAVANNVDAVIKNLKGYVNSEDCFYDTRAQDISVLDEYQKAARTIFLNKTCFNGLYRVNRQGNFNVPFGRYKNPNFLDLPSLYAASALLKNTKIITGDYKEVLLENASSGDFIFLDPPYLPISKYSDFKRYTKEQFYEEDQMELSLEVERLHQLGCHVILTNSNHPLVHDLYKKFDIEVVQTRRYINSNASGRKGEDVIVTIKPKHVFNIKLAPSPVSKQTEKYPSTRFMGSKNKLLKDIWSIASQFEFENAVDLFSGSGVVGYMFKTHGKAVLSNDYMTMSSTFAKAMIENNDTILPIHEAHLLLEENLQSDRFVQKTFSGLYYKDEENLLIDNVRANIKLIKNQYKKAIAKAALIRACVKKRPRGIFTYTGHRYDDGRRDLAVSLETQFIEAVESINNAVFDNGQINKSRNGDAMTLTVKEPGLVYIDPPYFSPLSDNEYVRRYHFVEGLAKDWEGLEIQENTLTKKFKSYPTPFSSRVGASDAFDKLFKKFEESVILVSYSSNSLPSLSEMVALISKYKPHVEVVPIDYKYSIGNQQHKVGNNKNAVQEYLFVGF